MSPEQIQRANEFARSQAGVPYQWLSGPFKVTPEDRHRVLRWLGFDLLSSQFIAWRRFL